ncbi:hypothetical protein [Methylobacterium sp. JK268]
MALEIDGLAILCAIAEAPEAFPAIRADVAKAARILATKQLKARDMTLEGLRQMQAALGSQPLALLVEGLSDAEVRGLAARFDPHNAGLRTAGPVAQRRRFLALAAGEPPAPGPLGGPEAGDAAGSPAAGLPGAGILDSAAMAAVPPRRRRPAAP